MYKEGYDLVCTSKVGRAETDTMFYKKSCVERSAANFMLLAPSPFDHLNIESGPESVVETVKGCVIEHWDKLAIERSIEHFGKESKRLVMTGVPWSPCMSDTTKIRTTVMSILNKMHNQHGFGLYGGINVKGGPDTWIFKANQAVDTIPACHLIIGFHQRDRIRLIKHDPGLEEIIIKRASNYYRHEDDDITAEDYFGARDIILRGRPWKARNELFVESCEMVGSVFEGLINEGGLDFKQTLRLSDKESDKSAFVFVQKPTERIRETAKIACILFTSSHYLRFINFPRDVTEELTVTLKESFRPGLRQEMDIKVKRNVGRAFVLKGLPWGSKGLLGYHARHMMMRLLHTADQWGWKLLCAADISGIDDEEEREKRHTRSNDYPIKRDTWFFIQIEQDNRKPPQY